MALELVLCRKRICATFFLDPHIDSLSLFCFAKKKEKSFVVREEKERGIL